MTSTSVVPAARPRRGRGRRLLLFGILLLPLGWLGVSTAAAWKLTRRSRPTFEEPAPAVEWAKIEGLKLKTADGEEIGGWLTRGDPAKACVVVLHGNNDSRQMSLGRMEFLSRKGYGALAISHRAHGDSTGERNDFGWSARADVTAAVEWLRREFPGRKIAVLGQSLGAAAAIFAAKDLGGSVCGYVLESPYIDLKTAVRNRTRMYLPRGLEQIAYASLVLCSGPFLPVDADRISTRDHVAEIPQSVPVLFLGGTKDQHTRIEDLEALHAAVASHAKLVRFEGASHSKLFDAQRELYVRNVLDFLGTL